MEVSQIGARGCEFLGDFFAHMSALDGLWLCRLKLRLPLILSRIVIGFSNEVYFFM